MSKPRSFKPVSVLALEKLKAHLGHMLLATSYGKSKRSVNAFVLECEDCQTILADWERR